MSEVEDEDGCQTKGTRENHSTSLSASHATAQLSVHTALCRKGRGDNVEHEET